ncbi:hypothetical protein LCGC14_0774920 [marine sediment metagenome]|uniref:Uncharacterized protein n=1 Tax=marine sediment metagenome TaxID=412755 RepID=A0A0F9T455_9ZZZZ|nr:MAG: hypothetical protein Lokiarch_21970 [Candidatus Lokiarchaeum sp. GC14_75]
MFLPIELIRKENIPCKSVAIDIFRINGRIKHLKEKFKEINFYKNL